MQEALSQGRIVWAEMADANGFRKTRPAVIVTPTNKILPGSPIHVVAVTTRIPESLPDDYVLLPWHPQGHARTKLKQKCAAVVTWAATITDRDIHDIAGVLPGTTISLILDMIRERATPKGPD